MRRCLIAVIVAAALAGPSGAQTDPAAAPSREQIEQIVREYLLRNPEILLEAMEALEERRREASATAQRSALRDKRDEIVNDPSAPAAGNPNGDVTVVEFFDYRCPYCKQVVAPLMRLLKDDGKIRFVFKELPILGPDSIIAARAALAAQVQGKYVAMHEALMRARGPYDESTVLRIATEAGLDAARLKADMGRSDIEAALERNRRLARDLAINGTPAFVIGDKVVPGAVDFDTLKTLVAEARGR